VTELRESKWTFETSNGGNLGAGIVAVEGGSVTLKDPSGIIVKFHYGAIGVGLGFGVKLPKLGRFQLPTSSGSSEMMYSAGTVYMSPEFKGDELTVADIEGGCLFGEATAALAWGHSGYVMSFGMNKALFAAGVLNPLARAHAHQSVRGYLVFHGNNYGLQGGVGATSFMGYMRA